MNHQAGQPISAAALETLLSELCSVDVNRVTAMKTLSVLAGMVKEEKMAKAIVDGGAIPALVRHLRAPPDDHIDLWVEVFSARTLCSLAEQQPGYKNLILEAGALSPLLDLLKRNGRYSISMTFVRILVIKTITSLAYENEQIKTIVRVEGGVVRLVELFKSNNEKLHSTTVWALLTLAHGNKENMNQIFNSNILDRLISMLWRKDELLEYSTLFFIRVLVESYPHIKRQVLDGALQLLIGVLYSSSSRNKHLAALLLGLFADDDSVCHVHMAQGGAIPPLVEMLHSSHAQAKEAAACTLSKLARDTHNQAGIAQCGGILPLLELLNCLDESIKAFAARTLSRLVQNEDNIVGFIELGGFQKLQAVRFIDQQWQYVISCTLKTVAEKIHGHVLSHLLCLMHVAEKQIQRRVVLAVTYLSSPDDYRTIFIDFGGLELLFNLMKSTDIKHRRKGSLGIFNLLSSALSLVPQNAAPPESQVYLGEQYVSNRAFSDVSFLVGGQRFYAHKSRLAASSDTFRAILNGDFLEGNAEEIEIKDISFEVFELMMKYIYTGSVEVHLGIACDLLKAADQYLLKGLKRLCEKVLAGCIAVADVPFLFEISETLNARNLRLACIKFTLEQFDTVSVTPWYPTLIKVMLAEAHELLLKMICWNAEGGMQK